MSSTAHQESFNYTQTFEPINGFEQCLYEERSTASNHHQSSRNHRELRRVAQKVVPMHFEGLVDQVEDIEYDDDGNVLEALPTPTCSSPIQEITPEQTRESTPASTTISTPLSTPLSTPMSTFMSTPQSAPHTTPPVGTKEQLVEAHRDNSESPLNLESNQINTQNDSVSSRCLILQRNDFTCKTSDVYSDSEAAYRAALCLQQGNGMQLNAKRALQLYKSAAVRNHPGALYKLGIAYFYGKMGLNNSNDANRRAGIKWLEKAAKVCNTTYNKAPHTLAQIFENGYKELVIPDGAQAVKLYTRSAELGYIPSATRLGRAYQFGELGCPQHAVLSIYYFNLAAHGNDPTAQLALSEWYMSGAGPEFPVNCEEAFRWAHRAALNGLPPAQSKLSYYLEKGIGRECDIEEANNWYNRISSGSRKTSEEANIRNSH